MREELQTASVSFDQETGVGHLLLNRPDSLNALSTQLREDIVSGFQLLEEQNEGVDGIALRAVIVEGADGNFSAGADVNEVSDRRPAERVAHDDREIILEFPVPVIAKIRGYCLGGGLETAMCCDFRFAHEDSRLGLPEVNLGLMPGSGGVQFVSRLANPSIGMEIAMTGEHISAERAHDLDLVNGVYGDDEFDHEVRAFAETIASKPPLAVQAIKSAAKIVDQTGLREARKHDRKLADTLKETEDFREGVRGFSEDDYEPEFRGQ